VGRPVPARPCAPRSSRFRPRAELPTAGYPRRSRDLPCVRGGRPSRVSLGMWTFPLPPDLLLLKRKHHRALGAVVAARYIPHLRRVVKRGPPHVAVWPLPRRET